MLKHYLYTILLSIPFVNSVAATNGNGYINPMKHPVLLSGNFGELRSNHFHSGLDYKTEGVQGKPVMSVADGYVSRIGIEPIGYGNVLYITHPSTGQTSVYGHLSRYSEKIENVAREYLYKNQITNAEINLKPNELHVNQGEIVAYSGNSGSSVAPHLHFELRDTKTDEFIDPMIYKMGVNDNSKPKLFSLKIYPQKNEGVLNGTQASKTYGLSTTKNGVVRLTKATVIKAWGKIGLGIKAFDYSNNSGNTLGLNSIRLQVDGHEIFGFKNSRFKLSQSRYVNSVIDYEEWRKNKSLIMKSFVDEGNFFPAYEKIVDRGFLTINEQRDYKIKYILADAYGNETTFSFTIKGVKTEIPQHTVEYSNLMRCNVDNTFNSEGIKFFIPKNNLYSDLCFNYKTEPSPYYSNYHSLHNDYTPLHSWCNVSIKVTREKISDTSKLVACKVENGWFSAVVGKYENGFYNFKIRDFGKYVIRIDTVPPKITPVNFKKLLRQSCLYFKISDNMSGINKINGYIDGKWVLFSYDKKSGDIKYYINKRDVTPNKEHEFKLVVTDQVGNESTYKNNFRW
jgi:hypothetical protein